MVTQGDDKELEFLESDEQYEEKLVKSIIVSNDRMITFRALSAYVHDLKNLEQVSEIAWDDFLQFEV